LLLLAACRQPSQPKEELEDVLPNVVTLTLTESGSATRTTATWRSTSDKPDPAARITIDTLRLTAGRTYAGIVEVRNDVKSPTVNLTEDYQRLANEHQFFYTVTGDATSRITITITDKDGNNLPLGLQYTLAVSAGAASTGALNVVLGHFDDVKKDGRTRSPESDIDITFPVLIR
jgi:hypothetical protein